MSAPYRIIALVIALGALQAPARADEIPVPSFDQVLDAGKEMIGRLDEYDIDTDAIAAPPSLDDWRAFWKQVEHALSSESTDELAWMLPEVQTALFYLDQMPAGKPYANWLRQRLDYFAMASDAAPATRPHREAKPTIRPPQRTSGPSLRANAVIRDSAAWRRKVAARGMPARAEELVPMLKEVFQGEGLPAQLVWLAEVESSMDPMARSPVGAMGLFQFMPATATRFGLSLAPSDERLDPEKSARAAAKYLKLLHSQFGTWQLAFAAYNAGEGTVGRLLKKEDASTFDQIAPRLPVETQMYVPKIMATVSLREGVEVGSLPAPIAMLGGL